MLKRLKFLGFTLTEVLITLGIIGVVAALTIPSLICSYKEKQTYALLNETYSIIAQAIKLAEVDYGELEAWGFVSNYAQEDSNGLKIAEKLKPYLKISKDCGLQDITGGCFYRGDYKYLNEEVIPYNFAQSPGFYQIMLMNGVSIAFFYTCYPSLDIDDYIRFVIDINGNKPPNQVGRDVFEILYRFDGTGLKPAGGEGDNTCSIWNQTGWGCAYFVLKNKNMNYLHSKKQISK